MSLNDNDQYLVNQDGTTNTVTQSNLMSIDDNDLLLVNQSGTTKTVKWNVLKDSIDPGPGPGPSPISFTPTISGNNEVGDVLTANAGAITGGTAPVEYAFQWKRNSVDIGTLDGAPYQNGTADYTGNTTTNTTGNPTNPNNMWDGDYSFRWSLEAKSENGVSGSAMYTFPTGVTCSEFTLEGSQSGYAIGSKQIRLQINGTLTSPILIDAPSWIKYTFTGITGTVEAIKVEILDVTSDFTSFTIAKLFADGKVFSIPQKFEDSKTYTLVNDDVGKTISCDVTVAEPDGSDAVTETAVYDQIPEQSATIVTPTIIAPPDGAGVGGDTTYTPKTSAITNVVGEKVIDAAPYTGGTVELGTNASEVNSSDNMFDGDTSTGWELNCNSGAEVIYNFPTPLGTAGQRISLYIKRRTTAENFGIWGIGTDGSSDVYINTYQMGLNLEAWSPTNMVLTAPLTKLQINSMTSDSNVPYSINAIRLLTSNPSETFLVTTTGGKTTLTLTDANTYNADTGDDMNQPISETFNAGQTVTGSNSNGKGEIIAVNGNTITVNPAPNTGYNLSTPVSFAGPGTADGLPYQYGINSFESCKAGNIPLIIVNMGLPVGNLEHTQTSSGTLISNDGRTFNVYNFSYDGVPNGIGQLSTNSVTCTTQTTNKTLYGCVGSNIYLNYNCVVRSDDDGENWSFVSPGPLGLGEGLKIQCLTSNDRLWLFRSDTRNTEVLYTSTDGNNWSKVLVNGTKVFNRFSTYNHPDFMYASQSSMRDNLGFYKLDASGTCAPCQGIPIANFYGVNAMDIAANGNVLCSVYYDPNQGQNSLYCAENGSRTFTEVPNSNRNPLFAYQIVYDKFLDKFLVYWASREVSYVDPSTWEITTANSDLRGWVESRGIFNNPETQSMELLQSTMSSPIKNQLCFFSNEPIPLEEGDELINSTDATKTGPSADDLVCVGSIPASDPAGQINNWSQALWNFSTNPEFSASSSIGVDIVPGQTQTWQPNESSKDLQPDTDYYLRLRYNLLTGEQSDWSATTHFKTAPEGLNVDDVFTIDTYAGNSSNQTLNAGTDYTNGGLVWTKCLTNTFDHGLHSYGMGNAYLSSNVNRGGLNMSGAITLNNNGYDLSGSEYIWNLNQNDYVSYSFLKVPGFFDVVEYTGSGGSGQTVSHGLTTKPGCMFIKSIDGATVWTVYHQSEGATKLGYLDEDQAFAVLPNLGNTEPTDTKFTVSGNSTNQNGLKFIAYLFADTPGLIKCGGYDGKGNAQSIDCGFEPQWLMVKNTDASSEWAIFDTKRDTKWAVYANSSAAQANFTGWGTFTSTGFDLGNNNFSETNTNGQNYVYIAIAKGGATSFFDTEAFKAITDNDVIARYGVDPYTTNLEPFGIKELTHEPTGVTAGFAEVENSNKLEPVQALENTVGGLQKEVKVADAKLEIVKARNKQLRHYMAKDMIAEAQALIEQWAAEDEPTEE